MIANTDVRNPSICRSGRWTKTERQCGFDGEVGVFRPPATRANARGSQVAWPPVNNRVTSPAVIVSASADGVTTTILESEVGTHPRHSGHRTAEANRRTRNGTVGI